MGSYERALRFTILIKNRDEITFLMVHTFMSDLKGKKHVFNKNSMLTDSLISS